MKQFLALLLLLAFLDACDNLDAPDDPAPTAVAAAIATLPSLPTVQPSATPSPPPSASLSPDEGLGETSPTAPAATTAPSATPSVSPSTATTSPATATPTVIPTPDPDLLPPGHPLYPYTIEGLRARDYPGGMIEIQQVIAEAASFTRTYISYPSDGLTITGIMQVPYGDGPFPVAILLHGYIDRHLYSAGADTWQAANYLAERGFLTIAPDYRTWGGSDHDSSLFHTGLVADALNLISSLPSLPQADPARVVLWGHSMGGGISTKILTIDDRPLAAVLYAPNSPDDADLIARWGPGCRPGVLLVTGSGCNPGEFVAATLPAEIMEAYYTAAADPAFLRHVAPLYHLDAVSAPVQIHIGTADGGQLNATPPEWSDKLYTGLLAADKQVAFFSYPGEGHAFGGIAFDEMMARALELYQRVIGDQGSTQPLPAP